MGDLELLDAVGDDDVERVRRLLDAGADPNSIGSQYGNSALSRACFRNCLDVVVLLLERGADPNVRLTYRSPVDGRTESGVVALMFARSPEVVKALLRFGADPNISDSVGETPLMRAALACPPSAVKAVLESGANPLHRNQAGYTALDLVQDRLRWHKRDGLDGSAKPRKRIADLEEIQKLLEQEGHLTR